LPQVLLHMGGEVHDKPIEGGCEMIVAMTVLSVILNFFLSVLPAHAEGGQTMCTSSDNMPKNSAVLYAFMKKGDGSSLMLGEWTEKDTNRPGMDYKEIDQIEPRDCEEACKNDSQCKSYSFQWCDKTYLVYKCWLKSGIPSTVHDACYVSGVKPSATTPQPPSSSSGSTKTHVVAPEAPDTFSQPVKKMEGLKAKSILDSAPHKGQVQQVDKTFSFEVDVDRPGMDILPSISLAVANPKLCEEECRKNPDCKAYTFVKPGAQGQNARCWLKHGVPDPIKSTSCISGVRKDY